MKKAIVSAVAAVFCGAPYVFAASAGLAFEGNNETTGYATVAFDSSFAGAGGTAVYRADKANMAYSILRTLEPDVDSFTDDTMKWGREYVYRLAPVDAQGAPGAMSEDSLEAMRIRRIERDPSVSDSTLRAGMTALPLIATTCRPGNAFDGDAGTYCENWWGGHAYYTMYSVVGIDLGEPYHIVKYRAISANLPNRIDGMQLWGTSDDAAVATAAAVDDQSPGAFPAAFEALCADSSLISSAPIAYDSQRWYEIACDPSGAYRYAFVWAPQRQGDGWGWCADISELQLFGWAESDVASVDVLDPVRDGGTVALTLKIDSKLVGSSIYAVSAPTAAGLAEAQGTQIGGPVSAGEDYRHIEFAVGAGDKYFLLRAVDGPDFSECDAIEIASIPERSLSAPAGLFQSVSAGRSSAGIGVTVMTAGSLASWCDVKVAYGYSADSLDWEGAAVRVDSQTNLVYVLSGLKPGSTYHARVSLANDLGLETVLFDDLPIMTEPEGVAYGVNLTPTIKQARVFGNSWALGFDILASSDCGDVDGCYALHFGDYTGWTVTYPDGTSGTCTWTDYITFGYIFWMHFDAAEYAFTGVLDDNCNVYVSADADELGTLVLANWYNAQDTRTWNCPAAGLYKVTIYCGNGNGGFGAYAGIPGASWRKTSDTSGEWQDGSGNWWRTFTQGGAEKRYYMPVDAKPETTSELVNGDTASVSASFPSAAIGGTAKAYWGASYLGEDPAGWNEVSGVGGTLGVSGVMDYMFEIPAGAAYLRYAVEKDGIIYWTDAMPVGEMTVVDSSKPVFNFSSVGAVAYNSAELGGAVIACGGEETECALIVEYGYAADNLEFEKTFAGKGAGNVTLLLDRLAPAHTYFARIYAKNANDDESDKSAVFSFTTARLDAGTNPIAGLWEGYAGTWVNVATNDCADYHRVLSTYSADLCVNRYYPGWDKDGNPTTVTGHGSCYYLYDGWIFLDDADYYVFTDIDDQAWMYFGEELVYSGARHGDANLVRTRDKEWWTGPGWYKFALETQDGGGGAGPWDGKIIGAGWNTNGISAVNTSATSTGGFNYFTDPGDGSFLRVSPGARDVKVASFAVEDGRLTAELEFAPWQNGDTVYLWAAYGVEYGGADTNGWDNVAKVAEIASSDTGYSYTGPSGAHEDYMYLRFFTVAADGDWQWCDEPIIVPDASRPAFGGAVAADGSAGDSITVSGAISAAGSGATADLVVYVSSSPDMSDAIVWNGPSCAAGDEIAYRLFEPDTSSGRYIAPGSTCYVRAELVGANGKKDVAPVVTVVMSAAAGIASTVAGTSTAFATFSGTASTTGAGDGTATVYLYTGFDQNNLTNTASKVVSAGDMSFSFTVEFPEVKRTAYYAFMISNSCPTMTWTGWSDVASVYLYDTYQYHWNDAIHEGAWTDPANWTVDGNPPQATYPDSPNCAALFTDDGDGLPYKVTLDGAVNVLWFGIFSVGMDLSIEGLGKDGSGNYLSSITYHDWFQAAYNRSNMKLTLKDLYFNTSRLFLYDNDYRVENATIVLDGANVNSRADTYFYGHGHTFELKNGSYYNHSGGAFLQSGRNFHMIIDDSTFIETSGGCFYLVREPSYSSKDANGEGYCLVEFRGANPVLEARYFSVAAGDQSGAVEIVPELRFSIPVGGYGETGPIHCYNDGDYAFPGGNVAIDFTIAKDSPARGIGGIEATLVKCDKAGYFDFSRINLGKSISYDSEDEASATRIVAVVPSGGFAVFVK